MKKNKKTKAAPQLNPVAKHDHQFNKALVFRDKTKYNRNAKHRKMEPLPIESQDFIGKGFYPEAKHGELNFQLIRALNA